MSSLGLQAVGFIILAVLLVLAAISDACRYVIPNWLTAGVALTSAVSLVGEPNALGSVEGHIGAGLTVLAVGFLLFSRGLLGGGDVKLIAAMSVWTGFTYLPRFIAITAIAGAILAIVVLISRRVKSSPATPLDHRLPYGISIAAGGLDFCIHQGQVLKIPLGLFTQ